MPVTEVNEADVLQCCNGCGARRRVAMTSLSAGWEGPVTGGVEEAVIRMPPCEGCGGVEFLIRASETDAPHPAPGSFGHLHQLLVGALHAQLSRQGRVPAALAARGPEAALLAGQHKTEEALRRWFPEGLKMPSFDGSTMAKEAGK